MTAKTLTEARKDLETAACAYREALLSLEATPGIERMALEAKAVAFAEAVDAWHDQQEEQP